ncbi:MAG: trypsin-like peptidase domain-containing protein [Candidatus Saccharibacteria bacterium]|nr:trypsin-like peptidase domain-containing protein [Candidatus Saccharibacteria bacterium]
MAKQTAKSNNSPKRSKLALVVLCALASISAGFLGGWFGAQSQQHQEDINIAQQRTIDAQSELIIGIAEDVGASVVSVNVESEASARSFFGPSEPFTQESAGTGFILSRDGIVLTNRHVVPEGASEVSVTLSDGTELENVEVLGRTASSDPLDIAFLKINDDEGNDLTPVTLGNSSDTKVGERVIAIGNALGQFQNTVTSGIISGFGRSITARDQSGSDTLQNLFQTDAAINQGNSGGPLVNGEGKVIGVNTAVASGGAENIGFAIPIDDIKGLINSVLETGEFQRAYLGVRYIQLNAEIARELDIEQESGAYITTGSTGQPGIAADSPAEQAGLQEEDIIVEVNGEPVNEENSLVTLVGRNQVGDEITMKVIRGGEEIDLTATLEAAPSS